MGIASATKLIIKDFVKIRSGDVVTFAFTTFIKTLLGAIPFFTFLYVYGANEELQILPTASQISSRHVNITLLNRIEEILFGIKVHEHVAATHNPLLDVLSTVPYLMHYVIPAGVPFALLLGKRFDSIPRFMLHLGFVCWLTFAVWLILPHTPPWADSYLNEQMAGELGEHTPLAEVLASCDSKEGCAFTRVDAMFSTTFFHDLFAKGPVPYACFPSGHVAWATVARLNLAEDTHWSWLYVAWMAWATMYSCHHYFLDAVAGAAVAKFGFLLMGSSYLGSLGRPFRSVKRIVSEKWRESSKVASSLPFDVLVHPGMRVVEQVELFTPSSPPKDKPW